MTTATENPVTTLLIQHDIRIAATTDIAFAALLAQVSTDSEMPGGEPFPP